MNDRKRRVGKNEALFRRVNEQIESLNESFGALVGRMTIVCECGNKTCIEQIGISPDEYEALRADPTLFAVKPGHDVPNTERVIDKTERYWTVRKHTGEPAALATELDARS